jgi:hypothetical protein
MLDQSQLRWWPRILPIWKLRRIGLLWSKILINKSLAHLLHLALKTRADILTAVFILTRFTSAPTKYCHKEVKRVFRYLQGTTYLVLEYCSSDIKMKVFVASDNAGDTNSRKSTSGMKLFLGSSLIQWHSKKQSAVSLSTCEAEDRAMTEATKDPIKVQTNSGGAQYQR